MPLPTDSGRPNSLQTHLPQISLGQQQCRRQKSESYGLSQLSIPVFSITVTWSPEPLRSLSCYLASFRFLFEAALRPFDGPMHNGEWDYKAYDDMEISTEGYGQIGEIVRKFAV